MFVSLAGRWWPNNIVCWLEMWFPNIQKWSFSRWNTCNIGVGSFSIWGGGVQSQWGQLQYGEGIAKCTYTHICMHIHMYACTLMYMVIYTHSCMHTHVCMHAHAYACIHLYIYILIWKSLNQNKRFLRGKNKTKQIYTCNWVWAYVVNRKIMRFWRKQLLFPIISY